MTVTERVRISTRVLEDGDSTLPASSDDGATSEEGSTVQRVAVELEVHRIISKVARRGLDGSDAEDSCSHLK